MLVLAVCLVLCSVVVADSCRCPTLSNRAFSSVTVPSCAFGDRNNYERGEQSSYALWIFLEQFADEVLGFGGDLGERVRVERPLAITDPHQRVTCRRLAVQRRQAAQPTAQRHTLQRRGAEWVAGQLFNTQPDLTHHQGPTVGHLPE